MASGRPLAQPQQQEHRLVLQRRLYNAWYLIHTRTWWRISVIQQISVSNLCLCSVLALLPGAYHRQYWLSPVSLAFGYRSLKSVKQLFCGLQKILQLRCNALPNARATLNDKLSNRLAYRRPRYDVYLPTANNGNNTAVMILPGAYVEHASYATIAHLLCQHGYTVVVVSAEPLRLTDPRLPGFTSSMLRSIQQNVSQQLDDTIQQWQLVGHSMGSFAATKVYQDLKAASIVLWASAPYYEYMKDISSHDIPTLVIQGSLDFLIAKIGTPERTREYWKRLPPHTQIHTIKGGTHCGFASYKPLDPEEGIDPDIQQDQAVKNTVQFWKQLFKS